MGRFEDVDDHVDAVEDLEPDFLHLLGEDLGLEDDGVVLSERGSTLTHL